MTRGWRREKKRGELRTQTSERVRWLTTTLSAHTATKLATNRNNLPPEQGLRFANDPENRHGAAAFLRPHHPRPLSSRFSRIFLFYTNQETRIFPEMID